ncbi:MAG: hypothetical protein AAGC60_23250 [Acidobacteriota bacterium]
MSRRFAYATLCAGDDLGYVQGALALRQALLDFGSPHDFLVLVDRGVPPARRMLLTRAGCRVVDVAPIVGAGVEAAAELCPWFRGVFDKLRLFELTEYDRILFLDSDVLLLRALDDLFERPGFVAAPDASRCDEFNSGLFVCEPSAETARRLQSLAADGHAWDGGDQSLLNQAFHNWSEQPADARLPFDYNRQSGRVPANPAERESLAAVHFYGTTKPWEELPDESLFGRPFAPETLGDEFERSVAPLLESWRDAAARGWERAALGSSATHDESAKPAEDGLRLATAVLDASQLAPALALAASLDEVMPGRRPIALTPPSLPGDVVDTLRRAGFEVTPRPWIVAPSEAHPTDDGGAVALSCLRLHLWRLEARRVLYLAPTVLALDDVADLAGRPSFAAAPRGQRPDMPGSRVLVLEPSATAFDALAEVAARGGRTFEACLHEVFGDWYQRPPAARLPQGDAFEIESFVYLRHTTLLQTLRADGRLRLLDVAPFVFERRWLVVPHPAVSADQCLDTRCIDLESPLAMAALEPTAREIVLDQQACDPLWARAAWRRVWNACRRRLDLDALGLFPPPPPT